MIVVMVVEYFEKKLQGSPLGPQARHVASSKGNLVWGQFQLMTPGCNARGLSLAAQATTYTGHMKCHHMHG